MSIEASASSIKEELVQVGFELRALSERLARLVERVGSLESSALADQSWELVEEGSLPIGVTDLAHPYPGATTSPLRDIEPVVPRYLIDLCSERLRSNSSITPVERAKRAFELGHSAWLAIATGAHYRPAGSVPHLSSTHWIVLRGLGLKETVRTSTRRDALRALASSDPTAIIEEFASFIELQTFCVAARVFVPPLKRCTSPASGLQR